ncbi:hypothetical protein V2J09_003891 [Rumex salicifolius]
MEEDDRNQLLLLDSSFIAHEDDIPPITGAGVFLRELWVESKKLWYLAGPAIFSSICQYSLGAVTQVFVGHVSTIALAAYSIENSVIAGFSLGIMAWLGTRRSRRRAQLLVVARCGGSDGLYTHRQVWTGLVGLLLEGVSESMGFRWPLLGLCRHDLFGAVSVRVSNELGAAHPRTAKFAVVVAVATSFVVGLILSLLLMILRGEYPSLFSSSTDVKDVVYQLTPLLAFTIIINNIQPVLSGVAVGAGWQAFVAYVNIGCYYIFGIPLGLILGYKLGMGVRGIWYGMVAGTIVQTCVLFIMVYKTNWNKEAAKAGDRIRHHGRQ